MKESLFEAFEDLEKLDDVEMLNASINDVEKIKSFRDGDSLTLDLEKIIDPQAESEDELKSSYLGKIILKCPVCHSLVYKALDEILADEETQCVNVGEQCPMCSSLDGFKVVGEVKEFEDDDFEKKVKFSDMSFEEDGDLVEKSEEAEEEEPVEEGLLTAAQNVVGGVIDGAKSLLASDEGEKSEEEKELLDEAKGSHIDFDKIMEVAKKMRIEEEVERDDIDADADDKKERAKAEFEKVEDDADADRDEKLQDHDLKESNERDDIDAEADDRKERARKRFMMARDAADADKDYRLHKAHMKTPDQLKESDEPAAEAIRKAQEWVDYDIKRYKGKISDTTKELVKRAGFQILEKDGKYIVASNDKALTEGRHPKDWKPEDKKEEPKKKHNRTYKNLDQLYSEVQDSLDRDLRRAKLVLDMKADTDDTLWTYLDKDVDGDEVFKRTLKKFGLTSKKRPFRGKIEFKVVMPKDIEEYNKQMKAKHMQESVKRALARKRLAESFNRVNIETDNYKMDMVADEDGKVTVTTEPVKKEAEVEVVEEPVAVESEVEAKDEIIEPLSDEVKAEIEMQSDETDYEDIDFNEIDEETFDRLGENYLKRNYSNVQSFKTTDGSIKGNTLMLEGLITFKSGKQAKTQFIFESKSVTSKGKVKFIGENKNFARGKKSFTLTGNVKDKKLVTESLSYNHMGRDAKTGKSKRLYGKVSI